MATLVLTAVGTVLGGPIGAAIGGVIGNQLDRAIFSPRSAKGPRLDSLAVQGSSYGSDLPRLFGTMRVSGSVIWATDLKEARHGSGGKGRASATTYSYSCSFAVALSARPIRAVHRIWADGDLLRGAAGDWKGEVGAFRVHPGDEAQAVDPLIAAAQGLDATPAHRGLAYVVFEDLQLADYGNRIPSLSFEVEADAEPVALAALCAELSDGAVGGAGGPPLDGYAAGGDSLRGAIEGLAAALPVAFADGPDGLALVDEGAAALAIPAGALGSATPGKTAPKVSIERQAAGTLNEALSISYYDPALDYQPGSQDARRDASARRGGAVQLPAAIDASAARGIVEARLAREWAGRTTASIALPWRHLDVGAGAILTLPGQQGRWRVTERALDGMVLTLTAQRLPGPSPSAPAASPGSGPPRTDLPHGPTVLELLDLPPLGDDLATSPALLIAAAGESAGWRRAALSLSVDDGASWQDIGRTALPAVMGSAASMLAPATGRLRDAAHSVDVLLRNDGMTLAGSDATALSASANLALLGDELIQFATAEQIGARLYRLGGLLRGRRGSEWAMAGHAAGERFILLDADTLLGWSLPASAIGGTVMVLATGIGDAAAVERSIAFQGRALRPPAPVALEGGFAQDGALALRWTRRSRLGWNWLDATDAPLGEEGERYRISVTRAGGRPFDLDADAPQARIPAAALAAIGGDGPLAVGVAQVGTVASSLPPAIITLPSGD